jgi:exodeoxyribonuclease VII small subunit
MPKDEPKALSFEGAMERLEKIVNEMESSKLPLEELLVRYEEGIRLIAVCNERLADAENRIETLTRNAETKSSPTTEQPTEGPSRVPTKDQNDEIRLF